MCIRDRIRISRTHWCSAVWNIMFVEWILHENCTRHHTKEGSHTPTWIRTHTHQREYEHGRSPMQGIISQQSTSNSAPHRTRSDALAAILLRLAAQRFYIDTTVITSVGQRPWNPRICVWQCLKVPTMRARKWNGIFDVNISMCMQRGKNEILLCAG